MNVEIYSLIILEKRMSVSKSLLTDNNSTHSVMFYIAIL